MAAPKRQQELDAQISELEALLKSAETKRKKLIQDVRGFMVIDSGFLLKFKDVFYSDYPRPVEPVSLGSRLDENLTQQVYTEECLPRYREQNALLKTMFEENEKMVADIAQAESLLKSLRAKSPASELIAYENRLGILQDSYASAENRSRYKIKEDAKVYVNHLEYFGEEDFAAEIGFHAKRLNTAHEKLQAKAAEYGVEADIEPPYIMSMQDRSRRIAEDLCERVDNFAIAPTAAQLDRYIDLMKRAKTEEEIELLQRELTKVMPDSQAGKLLHARTEALRNPWLGRLDDFQRLRSLQKELEVELRYLSSDDTTENSVRHAATVRLSQRVGKALQQIESQEMQSLYKKRGQIQQWINNPPQAQPDESVAPRQFEKFKADLNVAREKSIPELYSDLNRQLFGVMATDVVPLWDNLVASAKAVKGLPGEKTLSALMDRVESASLQSKLPPLIAELQGFQNVLSNFSAARERFTAESTQLELINMRKAEVFAAFCHDLYEYGKANPHLAPTLNNLLVAMGYEVVLNDLPLIKNLDENNHTFDRAMGAIFKPKAVLTIREKGSIDEMLSALNNKVEGVVDDKRRQELSAKIKSCSAILDIERTTADHLVELRGHVNSLSQEFKIPEYVERMNEIYKPQPTENQLDSLSKALDGIEFKLNSLKNAELKKRLKAYIDGCRKDLNDAAKLKSVEERFQTVVSELKIGLKSEKTETNVAVLNRISELLGSEQIQGTELHTFLSEMLASLEQTAKYEESSGLKRGLLEKISSGFRGLVDSGKAIEGEDELSAAVKAEKAINAIAEKLEAKPGELTSAKTVYSQLAELTSERRAFEEQQAESSRLASPEDAPFKFASPEEQAKFALPKGVATPASWKEKAKLSLVEKQAKFATQSVMDYYSHLLDKLVEPSEVRGKLDVLDEYSDKFALARERLEANTAYMEQARSLMGKLEKVETAKYDAEKKAEELKAKNSVLVDENLALTTVNKNVEMLRLVRDLVVGDAPVAADLVSLDEFAGLMGNIEARNKELEKTKEEIRELEAEIADPKAQSQDKAAKAERIVQHRKRVSSVSLHATENWKQLLKLCDEGVAVAEAKSAELEGRIAKAEELKVKVSAYQFASTDVALQQALLNDLNKRIVSWQATLESIKLNRALLLQQHEKIPEILKPAKIIENYPRQQAAEVQAALLPGAKPAEIQGAPSPGAIPLEKVDLQKVPWHKRVANIWKFGFTHPGELWSSAKKHPGMALAALGGLVVGGVAASHLAIPILIGTLGAKLLTTSSLAVILGGGATAATKVLKDVKTEAEAMKKAQDEGEKPAPAGPQAKQGEKPSQAEAKEIEPEGPEVEHGVGPSGEANQP